MQSGSKVISENSRKRFSEGKQTNNMRSSHPVNSINSGTSQVKKRKQMINRFLSQSLKTWLPEYQAYEDLTSLERLIDTKLNQKRLQIQDNLKKSYKIRRKLRICISTTTFYNEEDLHSLPYWELKVEGKLLDSAFSNQNFNKQNQASNTAMGANNGKRFSSFFKSLVIELDKSLYGPDNHLVEWHRTTSTTETDGFQVKRPLSSSNIVRCTLLFLLDHQPPKYKLDGQLARVLAIQTASRTEIIKALWEYIKTHKLQDPHERDTIVNDKYLSQIFSCDRMKFFEIPQKIQPLLLPPEPIVINHIIRVDPNPCDSAPKTTYAYYDLQIEVEDAVKDQANNFLMSTSVQQEISILDIRHLVLGCFNQGRFDQNISSKEIANILVDHKNPDFFPSTFYAKKIQEVVEAINTMKRNRDFVLGFASDPIKFINNWLASQASDLQIMTDIAGNPEQERHSVYYKQPWVREAVFRYFFNCVQQKRLELEAILATKA